MKSLNGPKINFLISKIFNGKISIQKLLRIIITNCVVRTLGQQFASATKWQIYSYDGYANPCTIIYNHYWTNVAE